MIEVNDISKKYGELDALKAVNFTVAKGELFGLIGPDGAGKTSLFRILASLQLPDDGRASVAGYDLSQFREIRNVIGYMPGKFSLYQDLSVKENLAFFATVFGVKVADNYDLIKDIYVQIEPFKNRRAGALSGGMKQKLALCCALIHKPEVLLLDEPTTGVDPVSRMEFWEMLQSLKKAGITILVSTPFMDEAGLCERIALIDKGRVLKVATPANISAGFGTELLSVRSSADMHTLLTDLRAFNDVQSVFAFGESVHVTLRGGPAELQTYLREKGHDQLQVDKITPGIEDAFIQLMKND